MHGPQTDTGMYYRLNQAILDLDIVQFEETANELLGSLETRALLFEDEENFPLSRFDGWITALKFICGTFHFANNHFLNRQGDFLDSPDKYERLCKLTLVALEESERRWDIDVPDLPAWIARQGAAGTKVRNNLSNTINYLMRDAYRFNHKKTFDLTVLPHMARQFDISLLVSLYSSGIFPMNQDPVRDIVMDRVDTLNKYLLDDGKNSARELVFSFESTTSVMRNLVSTAIRCNRNLLNADLVDRLVERYNLASEGQIGKPAFNAALPSLKGRSEYAEFMSSTHAQLSQATLQSTLDDQAEMRMNGDFSGCELAFLDRTTLRHLNLGMITQVIGITRLCPDVREQRRVVDGLKSRLAHFAQRPAVNGDVNFIARCIELDQLDGDVRIAEDHHKAITHLIRTKKVKAAPVSSATLEDVKKVALFSFDQDRVLPNLVSAMLPILQDDGYAFFNLAADCFQSDAVQPWKFSPRVTSNMRHLEGITALDGELLNDWIFDPEHRIIRCNGINIFQGLYERISRVQKRFEVDWNAPSTIQFRDIWVRQIDRLVSALDGVRAVCESRDIKVLLMSLQSHFAPYCMLRAYAEQYPNTFSHLTFNSSYENWKSNMSGERLSTVTLINNTRVPEPSNPAFGTAEDFENWFASVYQNDKVELWNEYKELVSLNRAGELTQETSLFLRDIRQKAAHSKNVFCALGKIPYDLAVPYQGGPGHTDFQDWINHTIESVQDSDTLLLIKPHPHELNYQISGKPNQGFIDLIHVAVNKNVVILPHRGISFPHLDSIVDHYTCWNGSSIAELGAKGMSIIACDDWASKNYPIDVMMPKNRDSYRSFLRGDQALEMHADFEVKSKAYVIYLTMAPFSIRYPFTDRSATNKNFNRAWINWDAFYDDKNFRDLENYRDMILQHV